MRRSDRNIEVIWVNCPQGMMERNGIWKRELESEDRKKESRLNTLVNTGGEVSTQKPIMTSNLIMASVKS